MAPVVRSHLPPPPVIAEGEGGGPPVRLLPRRGEGGSLAPRVLSQLPPPLLIVEGGRGRSSSSPVAPLGRREGGWLLWCSLPTQSPFLYRCGDRAMPVEASPLLLLLSSPFSSRPSCTITGVATCNGCGCYDSFLCFISGNGVTPPARHMAIVLE